MKLTISFISVVGSLLCISPIFGQEKLQCKSNQECIKLRDCSYTKKLLTRVLSSSDREEKNDMIAEMRKLACNPLDRSVCCDKVESEAEDEAKGDHEESDHMMSDPEAEGDHEESNTEVKDDHEDSDPQVEKDHEESDPEAEGDHEESNPEAEGDHEESEAEAEDKHEEFEQPEYSGDCYYDSEASGDYYYDSEVEVEAKDDHEESEAVSEGSGYDDQNRTMDTLGKFIVYD